MSTFNAIEIISSIIFWCCLQTVLNTFTFNNFIFHPVGVNLQLLLTIN